MRIRLLAFASAGDAVGRETQEVDLPAGSRVADLKARLGGEHPALVPLWPRLAIAVDGELAGEDRVLADGAEVALLPPVSGGAPDAPGAALVDGPIDVPALLARVAAPGRGAVLLFLGTVRDRHRGREVGKITYSGYRPMALARLAAIVAELEAEHPGLAAAIVHRLGEIAPGAASVAIATASPHRAEAYAANRRALERLKAEVPIWKREHYVDGEAAWREEESLVAGSS
jgi:MoaE-MoaD fusion protein